MFERIGSVRVRFSRHLEITDEEWQVFLDDFKQTLDKFKVPEAEQSELFAIVESRRILCYAKWRLRNTTRLGVRSMASVELGD